MKVFFHGWFGGFIDKTNPGLNADFFLNLFEKVYSEKCELGTLDDSEILCEYMAIYSETMAMNSESVLNKKKWKNTYCFSGESWTNKLKEKYDCVLWGERNHDNVVNVPLFVPYIYTNNFVERLQQSHNRTDVPKQDVCVVVSNPNGVVRNNFLTRLEKRFRVTYLGRYKNNVGQELPFQYNDEKFIKLVSQFKFIVSMENSRNDTYITEKIIHGMLAKTVPIYWGSDRIQDYFNKDRFLNLTGDERIDEILNRMQTLKNNPNHWLDMVNKPNFPNNGILWRDTDEIVKDINTLLTNKCWNTITRIYVISNKHGEPERYEHMTKLLHLLDIDKNCIKFIAPTYKHTITDEQYNYHANKQWVLRLRGPNGRQLSKGSLSLILNYRENLRDIEKNYKDGKFLIFESDLLLGGDIGNFNDFLNEVQDKNWDAINVGWGGTPLIAINKNPIAPTITGYRNWDEKLSNELNHYLNSKLGEKTGKYCSELAGCYGYNAFCKAKKSEESAKNIVIKNEISTTDKNELYRKFCTRCCEAVLYRYNCVSEYLKFIDNMDSNLSCPNDYVMTSFFENNINIKHYWCKPQFFSQGSNSGIMDRTYEI